LVIGIGGKELEATPLTEGEKTKVEGADLVYASESSL